MAEQRTDALASDLATGFAKRIERWARARGASVEAARAAGRAARAVSLAGSEGHVCTTLERVATTDPTGESSGTALRSLLDASTMVGTPTAPGTLPLIVDGDGRVYLHRQFDYECRLARRLLNAARPIDLGAAAMAHLRSHLEALSPTVEGAQPDWQKLAVALAMGNQLAIISGGPGTGKTTMVVNLLACLLEFDPDCRVALAAPTGKAAARMFEAIRDRSAQLPEVSRARLPSSAHTVHRLLGVSPSGGFVHNAANPLPIDALIVDEASMLDLSLATQLLEAVPAHARIVLIGDKDQLAAVEAGAVFAELSRASTLTATCRERLSATTGVPLALIASQRSADVSVLPDAVVWFTRNYRFAADSGIGRLASLVHAGDADALVSWLSADDDVSVRWAPSSDPVDLAVAHFGSYVSAVVADVTDHRAIHAAFAQFRVLCAVRDGARGIDTLNEAIATRLRERLDPNTSNGGRWFSGRPVLVRRNDYMLGLFNGDVGVTLPNSEGELMVWFPDAEGRFRAIAPARLPEHDTAFAMTIHQSQGSEFGSLLLVLPERASRVLTRELVYTGVTRARAGVTLCAPVEAIRSATTTSMHRLSGLAARIGEARRAD